MHNFSLFKFILTILINLYMFPATMCPSSGETTVFMQHLVLVILCGWLSGMQFHSTLHTRQSSIQNHKYQESHKYSCFSWWWAHSCPKQVQIDKYTKKNCSPSWLYLQDYTRMHSQQNIKLVFTFCSKLYEKHSNWTRTHKIKI